jgi:hypothetical protein
MGRTPVIGAATKVTIVTAILVAGCYFMPQLERLAHDPRLIWIAALPVAYVAGMLVLMHES